jgi:hypothetical protein
MDLLELIETYSEKLSSYEIFKSLFLKKTMTNNMFYYFFNRYSQNILLDDQLKCKEFFEKTILENNLILSKSLEGIVEFEKKEVLRIKEQSEAPSEKKAEDLEEFVRLIVNEHEDAYIITSFDSQSYL